MRHFVPTPQVASLSNIRKLSGQGGQIEVVADVSYGIGPASPVRFIGSVYGSPGPVWMVSQEWGQVYVTDPARFGSELDAMWVRRFYA